MECDGVWGLGYRIAFVHVRTFMVIRDGLYKETMRTKRQIEEMQRQGSTFRRTSGTLS